LKSVSDNYFLNYHQIVLSRILSGQTALYQHQTEALLAIYQKACRGEMSGNFRQAALILAGVGCGKTLAQALSPYILAPWMKGQQVLYLSDNCTLRSRFLKDFPTDSKHRPIYDQWLLYSLKVLPQGVPPPKMVELDASNFNAWAYAMGQANMLVGNRQFLVNLVQRGDIEPSTIGLIVCDEAHFSAAASYRTIFNYFDTALITYFTGSKFRADSQPLPHVSYTEIEDADEFGRSMLRYAPVADYEFSVQQAWKLNPPPIKKLCLQEATSTGFLVLENDAEVEYDPEEFLAKAQSDRAWFRQIMLADSFSLPVLEMAVQILLCKRAATGQPHAMLLRALNVPHVHRVAKLLEDNFPALEGRVLVIHSQHEQYDLAGRASALLERFYSGEYIVAVHCGLVGVGFDHKWISVSCCLCVLKSMSPAEQEWGRALRKVPGLPPGQFPELNHPNWGVVVTHSALGLRELFEKFQMGVISDVVKDAPFEPRYRPTVAAAYDAGETVLRLSDTKSVKPGDVLELRVPVAADESCVSKFNLFNELSRTGSLTSEPADKDSPPKANGNGVNADADQTRPNGSDDPQQLTLLPWQQEVDAIGARLAEIKSVRTHQVTVEAVLDGNSVQITPAWFDFPAGVEVAKSKSARVIPDADFVEHVGLDWQVMVGDKLISYREYQKQVVLQTKGMSLDQDGEIVANGVRLKDTMPPAVFELFVKGLDTELATAQVDVPHPNAIARPDKAKIETAERYGSQVRRLINDLFTQRGLISDGMNGHSLVERPVELLARAIERVRAKGHEPDFKNNSALVHSAVFGFLKEKTLRGWSEHTEEQQYTEAVALARQFLLRLREQLQWRSWR
jgi:hypothetical protein